MRVPAPKDWEERIAAFLTGERQAPEPRLAATLVLLRDGYAGGSGMFVYLLRRSVSMSFAGGFYAFPGGSADPVDHAETSDVLQVARNAAVRELKEETSVDISALDLHPWARWITPEFERRRYDTYFFVARVPEGAEPYNASTEADEARWARPGDAAHEYDQGRWLMLPPTVTTLRELADAGSVDAVLAETKSLEPVRSHLITSDDGYYLEWERP